MIKLGAGEYIGQYRVKGFLGRGGFNYVYRAEGPDGKDVALKVGDVAGGGRYVTRFVEITDERNQEWISPDETPAEACFFRPDGLRIDFMEMREIDEAIRLEGEKLREYGEERSSIFPKVHEIGEYGSGIGGGRPYIAMDYVRGMTLRERIRAQEGIRLNWFLPIVRELQRIGGHGDFKPENIIIKPSSNPEVLGYPVLIDPSVKFRTDAGLLRTATPHHNLTLREGQDADVFGVGVTLCEIMTSTLPFGCDEEDGELENRFPWEYAGLVNWDDRESWGDVERLSLQYALSHTPLRSINPNIPEKVERIIEHCLSMDESYGLPELENELIDFLRKD